MQRIVVVFSLVNSTEAASKLSACDCEMTDDDVDSKVSSVLPELMSVDGKEAAEAAAAAAVFITEPASQPAGCTSPRDDNLVSRTHSLVPPLISLRPLYTSHTQQQQQHSADELPGEIFCLRINTG